MPLDDQHLHAGAQRAQGGGRGGAGGPAGRLLLAAVRSDKLRSRLGFMARSVRKAADAEALAAQLGAFFSPLCVRIS